jgi:hypothetical protein
MVTSKMQGLNCPCILFSMSLRNNNLKAKVMNAKRFVCYSNVYVIPLGKM